MPRPPSVSTLVDELGELDQQMQPLKALAGRAEKIKAQLRAHIGEQKIPAEEAVILKGKRFEVEARLPPQREVCSMKALFDRLGQTKFLRICTVTIKAIEEALPRSEAAKMLRWGFAPTRHLKVRPLLK